MSTATLEPGRLAGSKVDFSLDHPAPDYHWSRRAVIPADTGEVHFLDLHVEQWRGSPWHHPLVVCRPSAALTSSQIATLYLAGGNPTPEAVESGMLATTLTGAPVVILFQLPPQPPGAGKTEDEWLGITLREYLESGDERYLLLVPMVQSAVRAMDVLQKLEESRGDAPISRFVVAGGSKRAWAATLTAAADRRVGGLVSLSFNSLNIAAQLRDRQEPGGWHRCMQPLLGDACDDLIPLLASPRGQQLLRLVDPWCHRERLTMPKLLISGSNDPYWAVDALRHSWNDLPGEKQLLMLPNAGHALDWGRVFATMVAFFRSVATRAPLPAFSDEMTAGKVTIQLPEAVRNTVQQARLWCAHAENGRFQEAYWQPRPMTRAGGGFSAPLPAPTGESMAWFSELAFTSEHGPYPLSTLPRVVTPA